jgi:FtsZ-binding cell division protein ZapB
MGVEDTYVFAGKSKIPFNAEGDFAEEFLSDLQEKVNVLYGEFTSHVAQMRGMTTEAVTNTEAKTFLADKAIQLGLADKAMEVEEFYSYLSTVASGETNSKMLTARFLNKTKQEDTAKMQELVELQAAFAALTDEKTQMEAQLSQAVEALTSAQAEASAVKEQLSQFQAEVETARLEAEAQAAQAKLDARQSRLEASVGKEEAVVLMASLGSLEDTAFETVAASFEKKAKAVEASPLFTEIGVGDQGDEEALSDTAKVLKAQYQNS